MSNLIAPPIEAQADLQRLRTDFPYFARKCLYIRTKPGEVIPFKLNRSQQYLHERIEKQRREKGRVRAIIVKGRQGGSSTYIQGRFFWRTWRTTQPLRAYILTHHDDATSNLFGMAERFYASLPVPIKPRTTSANAKEMVFADSGAGYKVATAGTKEVGRSDTIQLFHGSEVPSWPNAQSHVTGILQAVANAPGSESILESTAKGVGNVFHTMAIAAAKGDSEYEIIFVPWFWSEDYQTDCPSTHHFSPEWMEYGRIHKLHWEQLFWAWNKNRELAQAHSLPTDKICADFRQEYPATFEEAFQTSGNSFIPALSVLKARKPETKIISRGPIILGIDPARDVDKVGIIDRCGRVLGERICELWPPEGDTVFLSQRIAKIIDQLQPDAVNIDVGANGVGVYDFLRDKGYGDILNPVNFGSAPIGRGPTGDDMYVNRRAEMYDLMRDWFESPGGVQVPDSDALHIDLTAATWGPGATRYNTGNELIIEDKQKIKERLGHSPDLADAAALTFAVPFSNAMQAQNQPRTRRRTGRTGY